MQIADTKTRLRDLGDLETTEQFGLGFSYIKPPPSKPLSSSRRCFVISSVALNSHVACSGTIRFEWKISLLELTEILPSSATRQLCLEAFLDHSDQRQCFRTIFKVFFAYLLLAFCNFCQSLSLQVHTLRVKHFVCVGELWIEIGSLR